MRFWAMTAAGAGLLAMSAGVNPAHAANASRFEGQPVIVLAQAGQPKKETVAHEVKRKVKNAWRRLTGYQFDVACVFNHTTCTETGKDRAEARGKCIQGHPLCLVSDMK
jgi:hypothetical protein